MLLDLFLKGGPIMWPLLLLSLTALTVSLERLLFLLRQRQQRNPALVAEMLNAIETGHFQHARHLGAASKDFVAATLASALSHPDTLSAMSRLAARQLHQQSRGLPILETAITLAPLLGLLGTVTGMIHSFGLLGASELGAPAAITGGIAEALIATGFGLAIAIAALVPFNFLNTRLDRARLDLEEAANTLESALIRHNPPAAAATPLTNAA